MLTICSYDYEVRPKYVYKSDSLMQCLAILAPREPAGGVCVSAGAAGYVGRKGDQADNACQDNSLLQS